MLKGILQDSFFYCNHLGVAKSDERDIIGFSAPRGPGLVDYLCHKAFKEEKYGEMRTYMVRDLETSELSCYFSLKAGMISVDEHDDYEYDMITRLPIVDPVTGEPKKRRVFRTLPGIELANFAVNAAYIDRHEEMKGLGVMVFNDFILPLVRQASEIAGVKLLYIFALPFPTLMQRYHDDYGFSQLNSEAETDLHKRMKPQYDDYCKFMYRPLKA